MNFDSLDGISSQAENVVLALPNMAFQPSIINPYAFCSSNGKLPEQCEREGRKPEQHEREGQMLFSVWGM